MTRTDITTAKRLITGLIHQHMPSAAVASGWASAVSPDAWVSRVSALFKFVDRPEDMGLTALTGWLAARGVEAGESFVKALRKDWMMTRMAEHCHRHPESVACFADAR